LHGLLVEPASSAITTTSSSTESASGSVVRRLVDTDHSTVKLDVVHGANCLVGIFFLSVSDKSKATATASVAILDDDSFLDGAKLLELLSQGGLLGVPCQATDKKLRHD
jgi:hypothetical protein